MFIICTLALFCHRGLGGDARDFFTFHPFSAPPRTCRVTVFDENQRTLPFPDRSYVRIPSEFFSTVNYAEFDEAYRIALLQIVRSSDAEADVNMVCTPMPYALRT